MQMQLNRDYVHVSLSGLSIEFKKDTPVFVPPRLVREIVALGGTASDDSPDKAAEVKALAEISAAQAEDATRAPKINEAIRTMIARNQRGDFTAASKPNLRILMNLTGLEITPEELAPMWDKIKAEIE